PFKIDTTPPHVTVTQPTAGAVFTTTHLPTRTIAGTATDARSGVAWVEVTTDTVWVSATGTENWSYTWTLPLVDRQVYTLAAQAYDYAGNRGLSADVSVTVDTVAPAANMPIPHRSPWVTSTVVYTWTPSSDNSGTAGYRVNITNTAGYSAITWTTSNILTFTGALTEGAGYFARVLAVDGLGNVGDWSGPSTVVTPDLTPPTILSSAIVEVSDFFHVSGLTLFYTNTMPEEQSFSVQGRVTDTGPSGLERVIFSTAFGYTPTAHTTFPPYLYAGNYFVSQNSTESGHITVTVYDRAGNFALQIYTYTLDGEGPYTGSVVIQGGAEYVSSTNVSLGLFAADAGCGVAQMCMTNTLAFCNDWRPYTTTLANWNLDGSLDGIKTVYAWFKDHLGNTSGPYTDTVVLDRQLPSGSITIDNDVLYATQVTVTLSLTAADGTSGLAEWPMRFSNNGTTWSNWEPFTTTRQWTLDTADGLKTVYVQYRDRAGNVATYSDAITLDQVGPTVSITRPTAGQILTPTASPVNVFGAAHDATSGVAWVEVNTGTASVSATGTANWSYTWTLPLVDRQVYTLTAQARDNAGNWGPSASVTVTVDTVAPAANMPIPHRSPWVTSTVVYTWTPSSDNSGIAGYWVNITNTAGYSRVFWASASVLTFTEALTEGERYYARVLAVDGVGNAGPWSERSTEVIPDLSPPQVTVTAPAQIPTGTFVVSWSADDGAGSGVAFYTVAYREDDGSWQTWIPMTTTTSATFVSGTLEHTYVFSVTATDGVGHRGTGTATTKVAKWRAYIPLVLRNYRPFVNGSFEEGLSGWTVIQNPLPVSVVDQVAERTGGTTSPADGSRILLLGNPDYPCFNVPLGHAAVEQTFVVPQNAISLTFQYIIWTQDGSPVNTYSYDLFEVFLNNERKFDDTNRVNTGLGCAKWWRVPGPDNPRNNATSGWARASIDLMPYRGQTVTLSFRLYSRHDQWYNTYVYIDDVRVIAGP
ncbi:MAG: Ig-like domain-containing protein, partial [Anaerolineae bacterium]|nr:Ig-like domain-containing protein [Anaerolineae bacterium]